MSVAVWSNSVSFPLSVETNVTRGALAKSDTFRLFGEWGAFKSARKGGKPHRNGGNKQCAMWSMGIRTQSEMCREGRGCSRDGCTPKFAQSCGFWDKKRNKRFKEDSRSEHTAPSNPSRADFWDETGGCLICSHIEIVSDHHLVSGAEFLREIAYCMGYQGPPRLRFGTRIVGRASNIYRIRNPPAGQQAWVSASTRKRLQIRMPSIERVRPSALASLIKESSWLMRSEDQGWVAPCYCIWSLTRKGPRLESRILRRSS